MCDYFDLDWQAAPAAPPTTGPYIPDAQECMRCGVCVSSCPAYKIATVEAESPRFRVGVLRRLLQQQQIPDQQQRQHLQHCVQCRQCETVCPSRMPYGAVYESAMAVLQADAKPGWLERSAFALIERKWLRQLMLPWLGLYLNSGLQMLLRRSGFWADGRLEAAEALARKPVIQQLAYRHPVKFAKTRGRVALFGGCLGEAFDRETLNAAIKVLNRIGFEVVVPPQQVCCGALHRHNGRNAQALIEQNLRVFYNLEVGAVLYSASGCGAMLAEYHSKQQAEALAWFRSHLFDINEFVLAHWPPGLQAATSHLNVVVHEPCSQRNVLKNTQAAYQLLALIPGVSCSAAPDNAVCCGAGGSYLLKQPQKATQLRALKQHALQTVAADVYVSGNFGCIWHLQQGHSAEQAQWLHPIRLLADRL
jgi:glycolate oxidase iron-sulfur subunit